MPKATITRTLAKAPPEVPTGTGKVRYFDDRTTGFIMEVRSSVITFYFRYSDDRRRAKEIKLGRYGDVTVDQARKRAEQLKAEVSLGGDPNAERARRLSIPTFAAFVKDRYLPYALDHLKWYPSVESACRLRLVPALGSKALDEIGQADVIALISNLHASKLSGATVNRSLAILRRIFNLARKWQVYEGSNPTQHIPMAREQHRTKFLSVKELKALFRALDKEEDRSAAGCIALLVFTGARRGEALNARWSDIDLEKRIWTVPLSKNGHPRHIPLSNEALRVLAGMTRLPGNPFVFPGKGDGRPLEGLRGPWARVKKAAGLDDGVRLHDLRHTFASVLVNHGRSLYEVGQILGHRQLSTTTRYAHLQQESLLDAANTMRLAIEAGRSAEGARHHP